MARRGGASESDGRSLDRARNLVEGHLNVLRQSLVQTVAAQLDELESSWETRVAELRAENDRLRAVPPEKRQPRFSSQCEPTLCAQKKEEVVQEREPPKPWTRTSITDSALDRSEMAERSQPADYGSQAESRGTGDMRSSRGGGRWSTSVMFPIFSDLDPDQTGVVKVEALQEKLRPSVPEEDLPDFDENIPSLMAALRAANPERWRGIEEDEISYDILQNVVIDSDVGFMESAELRCLNVLRAACVHHAAMGVVCGTNDVTAEDLKRNDSFAIIRNRMWSMETAICCVILLNAAIIGLSMDIAPDSEMWEIAEFFCTLCFVMELVGKIKLTGAAEHFFGPDWQWNVFDFLLVVLAVTDLALTLYVEITRVDIRGDVNLRDVSVLRLLRLLRLARLARLLRINAMKELILMASGIVGGLRTLFWAIVMLFFFVYVFGILSHQIMSDWREKAQCGENRASCNEYELILHDNFGPLFGDLFKTCFTVIRCVTGDCNLHSGMPLAPILVQTNGRHVVIGYCLGTLFVSICVFNLLMAIFVENTLDYAQQDNEKKKYLREQEHVQRARQIQQLVNKILFYAPVPSVDQQQTGLWKYLPGAGLCQMADSAASGLEVEIPTNLQVQREHFDAAMALLDDVLEDLDVRVQDKSKLFDILDADGDGWLDVREIVDGILRLRGPADKSDIVANGLMIRSVQRSLEEVRAAVDQLQPSPQSGVLSRRITESRYLSEAAI